MSVSQLQPSQHQVCQEHNLLRLTRLFHTLETIIMMLNTITIEFYFLTLICDLFYYYYSLSMYLIRHRLKALTRVVFT